MLMQGKKRFEELDFRQTPLGDLILRRRILPELENREVYEIILGDAYLMTSLFTVVEIALSKFGMDATAERFPNEPLDVVVGGLGLGCTAREALNHVQVRSLIVVDYLKPVIEWHQRGLLPLGPELTSDPRCHFKHGDFFERAMATGTETSFDPDDSTRKFHAILLDIDHSPSNLLHDRHASFYTASGLKKMAAKLHPGGIFGLWSDDAPDDGFMTSLKNVFATCQTHVVPFHNPHQECESASTVYLAGL
jgi:spermidine synthase